MKILIARVATVGILLLAANYATADPIYYTDMSVFDDANSGLNHEDLDNLNVTSSFAICPNGLNSSTDPGGDCWDTGDVISGFTIAASGGDSEAELAVAAAGAFGQPEVTVYPNFFVETLNLLLDDGANAIGVLLNSQRLDGNFLIELFDEFDTLLGSDLIFVQSETNTFWGVSDTSSIYRINFASTTGQAEGIAGIWFGNTVAVPEPGTLALLGLGLAGMGLVRRRKKS